MPLVDDLRLAMNEYPGSMYQLSKESGVGQEILSRFLSGRGLSLATAEKLCEALGLELVQKKHPPRGAAKK